MIQPVSFKGIEDSVKSSAIVKNSKADALRLAQILEKSEKGEAPIKETLEFMEDKISDKKRNAIIAIGSFVVAAITYKNLSTKAMPYLKQAAKFAIGLLPEKTGTKISNTISGIVNKEIKNVKPLANVAEKLSNKAKINKVGDLAEWGVAGLAALLTSKGANEVGDKVDDAVDIQKLQSTRG